MLYTLNKENAQKTFRLNYQKHLQKLQTESQNFFSQDKEPSENIKCLLSKIIKPQKNNIQVQKEISSKPESSEVNMKFFQVDYRFSKIKAQLQSMYCKNNSMKILWTLRQNNYRLISREKNQSAVLKQQKGTQSDNAGNLRKNKKQKK